MTRNERCLLAGSGKPSPSQGSNPSPPIDDIPDATSAGTKAGRFRSWRRGRDSNLWTA